MSEFLQVIFACATGIALGAFFFGGLWWTIQKGTLSKQPALWFCTSLLLRMSAVLAGFYFLSRHYGQLLLCLATFTLVGLISTRLARKSVAELLTPLKEISHAPQP